MPQIGGLLTVILGVALGLTSAAQPGTAQEQGCPDRITYVSWDVAPTLANLAEARAQLREAAAHLPQGYRRGARVLLNVLIDETGTPQCASIKESSGRWPVDSAAMRVAATFRFTPATVGGKAVRVWLALPVVFGSTLFQPAPDSSSSTPVQGNRARPART